MTFEGDAIDATIDLTVNTVGLSPHPGHRPPGDGPGEMSIDVPEVTQTRLDQTVKNWPLGQTLLISAGIHPGVLRARAVS